VAVFGESGNIFKVDTVERLPVDCTFVWLSVVTEKGM